MLSFRFKESFKTALAMTTAYGIALAMDWEKPYWAAFAVAFIGLATVGQSLNKGAMRMLGTLLGGLMAFVILALFPQDRWGFILALSLVFAFCTYMRMGDSHQYFWHIGGVALAIIALSAGFDPVNAFDIAVSRAQETGLGILVYSLVTVLVWPSRTEPEFNATVDSLASTQLRLFQAYMMEMRGQGGTEQGDALHAEAMQNQSQFSLRLDAAVTDSFEVWEVRRQWRLYRAKVEEFAWAMASWRDGFSGLQGLDLDALLPNLRDFDEEIQARLADIGRMQTGQSPSRQPQDVVLRPDTGQIDGLSHFQVAALTAARTQLQVLVRVTRSLFEIASELHGLGRAASEQREEPRSTHGFVPDPERLTASVRVMAILWMAYLAGVYIPDIPNLVGFIIMSGSIGITFVSMPQISASILLLPLSVSLLFAGFVYLLIMPSMSSYFELGPLIFLVTFAICYLFFNPRQVISRQAGLSVFAVVTGITNEQQYDFVSFADSTSVVMLVLLILVIVTYFPIWIHPRKVFVQLLARFFRSAEYLLSTMRWDPDGTPTRVDLWRKRFHTRELATLPGKLGTWVHTIDPGILGHTPPQQVQTLVNHLQALSYRMQALLEARTKPQADFLVQELLSDVRAWRLLAQRACGQLSHDPASGRHATFRSELDRVLNHLEARVEEVLNRATGAQFSEMDGEHFYGLLGAYRSVSEALVDYAGTASAIDWARWRESRF